MKKRIISTLCATTMLLAGGLTLTACNKDEAEAKVMNVSLNPEVEFVLDKDNKVLSVNALNDEGNIIISGDVEFVGKDANDAVKLFVSVSKDNGYLVSGSVTADKNKLEVEISGEKTKDVESLYNSVKASIETKMQELDITGTVEKLKKLAKEDLQKVVAECSPYLEEAKVKAMSYAELLDEIKQSRKETKDYYSQELKEVYYQAKAEALRLAQLEKIKENASIVEKAALTLLADAYETAIDGIETARKEVFLDKDSPYQVALKAFNDAKADYLKRRKEISEMDSTLITDEIKNGLTSLDSLVEEAEGKLKKAYTDANTSLNAVKTALTNAYNEAVEYVTGTMNKTLDIVSSKLTQEIETFATQFETNYATYKNQANTRINDFKNEINPTTGE